MRLTQKYGTKVFPCDLLPTPESSPFYSFFDGWGVQNHSWSSLWQRHCAAIWSEGGTSFVVGRENVIYWERYIVDVLSAIHHCFTPSLVEMVKGILGIVPRHLLYKLKTLYCGIILFKTIQIDYLQNLIIKPHPSFILTMYGTSSITRLQLLF